MAVSAVFKAPFPEQLAYFRGKLNLPSERWDDIRGAAHDRAFIVAGAMQADLLDDLRAAVDKAIAQGTSLQAFRKDFGRLVERHGWDYKGSFDWRTKVIYQTNMRASYAAGRWAQLTSPAMIAARPYWRYLHADGVAHPRPMHLSWHGLTLRHDDPWWQTHFAPNGWGCKCRITAVRLKDLEGGRPDTAPDDGTYQHTDRLGVTHTIPKGIDYGWDHAPGATRADAVRLAVDKAAGLEPVLGADLVAAITRGAPRAFAEYVEDYRVWAAAVLDSGHTTGALRPVGAFSERVIGEFSDRALAPASAVLAVRDEDILHALRTGKHGALPEGVWLELPRFANRPSAVLLERGGPPHTVLLVIDVPGHADVGKLVVKVDYEVAVKTVDGKRRVKVNLVRSGKIVKASDLDNPGTYEVLDGTL